MSLDDLAYGDDVYDDRGELRQVVFEVAANRCEHPVLKPTIGNNLAYTECDKQATELAHIKSIGMGGRKTADTVNNTLAACPLHARSTDDYSSREWLNVPGERDGQALAVWVKQRRRSRGWAV